MVSGNLVVVYKEIKLFALLPQLCPQDFVDFLSRNYFTFLHIFDIFHKWFEHFHLKQFYDILNSLDEGLKFIFEKPTLNFLDIQLKILNKTLVFDIYYKPTNYFNYLT